MLQSESIIAIIMLFILLPASRLIHRFVYSLFDMFDRGNMIDEAAEGMVENTWKMMTLGRGMWNLLGKMYEGFTDARRGAGVGPGNGGGGGNGFDPSPHSPDRLASALANQNSQVNGISSIRAGLNNGIGQFENGVERNDGLMLNGNLQNEGPIQQYGHLPESRYLHEAQLQKQSLADNREMDTGRLMATGTDNNVVPFSPFSMEGRRNNAVFIPERNRTSLQANTGIRRRVPTPSLGVASSVVRPSGLNPLQASRAISTPPKVVPISRPTGATVKPSPANVAQIRPTTTSLNSSNSPKINATRPEPVRIQPVKSTIGAEARASQGPFVQSATPYSGVSQSISRSETSVSKPPSVAQLSTPSFNTSTSTVTQSRAASEPDKQKDTPIFSDNTIFKMNNYTERNEG